MKAPRVVTCNGATGGSRNALRLNYLGASRQLTLSLPAFVRTLLHLPARILDLLEIASYVYAADRLTKRGAKDAVEYHGWARSFDFHIRVRDADFWTRSDVCEQLGELLRFMSGDKAYRFVFQAGHSTPPTSLFDTTEAVVEPVEAARIVLFSGGLDSLTGILDLATQSQNPICLVSHESQPGTVRTQQQLRQALIARYGARIQRYSFACTLHERRSNDETQRTRMFLYGSIAAALAYSFSRSEFFIFENGITALNLPLRQDLINARATRTTHPKSLRLLERFLSTVWQQEFTITSPYQWHTKTDVVQRLRALNGRNLVSSSVSCSRTFQNVGDATHCGVCSQCVDRRLAMYASGLDDADDAGIYSRNFIERTIEDGETRTLIVDYIRQANSFVDLSIDAFAAQYIGELAELSGMVGALHDYELVERVWSLLRRHGQQVMLGIRRIREVHDNPARPTPRGSLLQIISDREYLKDPVKRFAEDVWKRLSTGLPLAFQRVDPVDENDVNDKVEALLGTESERLHREHPAVEFALARAVPDHSSERYIAFVEVKYLRRATTPSRASEGIAADLTKYPAAVHVIFVIYDPQRAIRNDEDFRAAFESVAKNRCTILIIR